MLMLTIVTALYAQSEKYTEAMKNNLEKFAKAQTNDEFVAAANTFERIGNAEKNQWLPYYYSALSLIRGAMNDNTIDKDKAADKAAELIGKIEAIDKTSEVYVLKYMNATLRMLVNPMQRWQTNGAEAEAAYQQGIAVDANNPRLYFLKAMSVMNTPEQFGGGYDKAKPLLEKAAAIGSSASSDSLYPTWGAAEAKAILEQKK